MLVGGIPEWERRGNRTVEFRRHDGGTFPRSPDRHYHVTLLSDTYLRKLLAELGLEQDIQWVQTRTGFYTDGKLYSMSNSLEFLRFPPLNLWNKCRLGATILHALRIKHWQALEEIPVEEWLRRWSGDRTTEKIH